MTQSGPGTGMKSFKISQRVRDKLLTKHNVTQAEVSECFLNRVGPSFRDPRERHDTDPPTWWFMSTTDRGRPLKVCYVEYEDFYAIKTAFQPNDGSAAIYEQLCAQHSMKGA